MYLVTKKDKLDSISMNKNVFQDIKESMFEAFGKESGTLLYLAGTKSGKRSAKNKIMESGGNVEEAFQQFIDLKQKQNWGDISFPEIDVKGSTGSIKLENCFEAPTIGENAQCFFTRGFLLGFLSEIFQKDIKIADLENQSCKGACEHKFWAIPD